MMGSNRTLGMGTRSRGGKVNGITRSVESVVDTPLSGATLTIEPGATVYLNSGVTITVSGAGVLLAQGTEGQRIRFTKAPASASNWGSLDFINTTVESRLAYIDFDSCGGTTTSDGHNAQLHVNGGSIVFIDQRGMGRMIGDLKYQPPLAAAADQSIQKARTGMSMPHG